MKNAMWVAGFVVLIAVFVAVGVLRKGGTKSSHQIGVIPKETESVYWEGVRQGALKAGVKENYTILWNGATMETDCERQIQIVEDMSARKVDGTVLAAGNRKGGGLLLPTFGGVATRPRDSVTPGKDFL